MKTARALTVLLSVLATASCASVRSDADPLCGEIAAFANASTPGSTHAVVLTTSWGPTKERPTSFMFKDCEHAGYGPGAKLCEHLMPNTSTEFAEINFRRVLACLNGQTRTPPKYVSVERIDTLMWGHEVPGVRPDVSVGVEFVSHTADAPVLKIMAKADAP